MFLEEFSGFHLLGKLEDDGFGEKQMWQTQKDASCGWCRAWQCLLQGGGRRGDVCVHVQEWDAAQG